MQRGAEGAGDGEEAGGGDDAPRTEARTAQPKEQMVTSEKQKEEQQIQKVDKAAISKCGGGGGWPWGKERKKLRLPIPATDEKAIGGGEAEQSEKSVRRRNISVDLSREEMQVERRAKSASRLTGKVAVEILGNTRCEAASTEQISMAGTESSAVRSGKENKVHINTAFSMTSLFKISTRLNDEKRELVQSIGFGSLIRLPEFRMFPRQIALWLLSNLDCLNCAIKLRNGQLLPFSSKDVAIVLGISSKGRQVLDEENSGKANINSKSSVLMLNPGEEPNIKTLEAILFKDVGRRMTLKEREAFKLAYVLYIEAVFLGAKGQNAKVNSEVLTKCSDTSIINKLDWSDYVVCCLKDSAKKVQLSLVNGKVNLTIEGCLFFLVVFYLDNLDFGELNADHRITPRYKSYSSDVVKNLVHEDKFETSTSATAEFGRTKLRKKDEVVYSRSLCRAEEQSMEGKVEQTVPDNFFEALSDVIARMNHWMESVKSITAETESEVVDCLRKLVRQRGQSKQNMGASNCESAKRTEVSCSRKKIADVNRSSAFVQTTPISDKGPVCINLETPDVGVHKSTGCDEDYSFYPQLCANQAVGDSSSSKKLVSIYGADNVAFNDNDWEYDDFSCYQRMRRDSSYDGMTNSEDSRLCYGLSNYPEPPEDDSSYYCTTDQLIEMEQRMNRESEEIKQFNKGMEPMEENQNGTTFTTLVVHSDFSTTQVEQQYVAAGLETSIEEMSPGVDKEGHIVEADQILYNDGKSGEVIVLEGSGKHIVTWCGQEFDGAHITLNSTFGLSPFAIVLTHDDAPLASVLKLYSAIRICSEDAKKSTWFIHKHPHEIQIQGWEFQLMFASINDFSKEVVNAIGRMFQKMDDDLFALYTEKRFRHLLPPEFADVVLPEAGYINPDRVAEMFIADHIAYTIGECKLILAPVCVDWNWSLYVWNFERRTIIVIDPVKMIAGNAAVMHKHQETVEKLHRAMTICKEQLFKEPKILMTGWAKEYLSLDGAAGNRSTSGLYTMFYARYFDGKTLTRILTYESKDIQKCNMLHQLLSLPDNVGVIPSEIRAALDHGQ